MMYLLAAVGCCIALTATLGAQSLEYYVGTKDGLLPRRAHVERDLERTREGTIRTYRVNTCSVVVHRAPNGAVEQVEATDDSGSTIVAQENYQMAASRYLECASMAPTDYARIAKSPFTSETASAIAIRVAVEADYAYFTSAGRGNPDLALAYTLALFDNVREIYEAEADITFRVHWFTVWTDSLADPYKVQGNAYALPDRVRAYWTTNRASVDRDLVHVMTSISYGGGGFGYYNALCNREYGFSVSSPTGLATLPNTSFTYDAYIVGHELGHNLDARHSHDCFWDPPLDTCYTTDSPILALGDACFALPITPRKNTGSLMSYCANANYTLSGNDFTQFSLAMTLLPKVAQFVRSTAEQAITNGCLRQEGRVLYIRTTSPNEFVGGTKEIVTWNSWGVERVRLEARTDRSAGWYTLRENIPSQERELVIDIPNEETTALWLRMTDMDNDSVQDDVVFPLRIRPVSTVEENAYGDNQDTTVWRYWSMFGQQLSQDDLRTHRGPVVVTRLRGGGGTQHVLQILIDGIVVGQTRSE
ncbi:MAG: zinc-dependent metalloprotease [Candidatus Kapabacteria bacterium]|nr:zinc-dependent metalloprotease [Candidatus Kapabacteria bacterium]